MLSMLFGKRKPDPGFTLPGMMTIACTGGTPQQRKLLESAARFYLTALFKERSKPQTKWWNIGVLIELTADMDGPNKGDLEIDEEDGSGCGTDFTVRIDSTMNMCGMLRTLAHECVHVAQYATGDMKETKFATITVWKGKEIDIRSISYWLHPWELEAYSREISLFENWVQCYRHTKKPWYIDYDYVK